MSSFTLFFVIFHELLARFHLVLIFRILKTFHGEMNKNSNQFPSVRIILIQFLMQLDSLTIFIDLFEFSDFYEVKKKMISLN